VWIENVIYQLDAVDIRATQTIAVDNLGDGV
jgi:hypothetical protein